MIKSAVLSCAIAFSLALTGCASITGSSTQSIMVQAREQSGREVSGASCELLNSKSKWQVTTPGSVSVTRSNDALQIFCAREGLEPGRASVESATKGAMFGNILLGGIPGAFVDHKTGAAYEYPDFVGVVMGAFTSVPAPVQGPPRSAPAGATNSDSSSSPYPDPIQNPGPNPDARNYAGDAPTNGWYRLREAYSSAPPAIPARPSDPPIGPWQLGAVVSNMSPAMAKALGFENQRGVLVTQVDTGGSAQRAGIAVGDVIISFNDMPVSDAASLADAIRRAGRASTVPAVVITNREKRNVSVEAGDRRL